MDTELLTRQDDEIWVTSVRRWAENQVRVAGESEQALGAVTAGDSSQTSDGAAAVRVMERENAESLGIKPLARFVGFAVGSIPPEMMGIGGGHL
jgi:acetyl-CoA acetyltransferase